MALKACLLRAYCISLSIGRTPIIHNLTAIVENIPDSIFGQIMNGIAGMIAIKMMHGGNSMRQQKGRGKMYQNYIFDLYGTLVDIKTNEEAASFWKKTARFFSLLGAVYTPAEIRRRYLELVDEKEKQLSEKTGIPSRAVEIKLEEVFEALFTEKGVPAQPLLVHMAGVEFRNASTSYIKLFPGAKELLVRLRKAGKGVYLLSNAQRIFTEPEMRMLQIYELFDGILYSSDAGVKKPSVRFFDTLLLRYHLKKEECVMIGNDCIADIQGAHECGMASMYIHTCQSTPLTNPLPEDCRMLTRIGEAFERTKAVKE